MQSTQLDIIDFGIGDAIPRDRRRRQRASVAYMASTLATKKLGSSLGIEEIRNPSKLLEHGESALVDGEEGDNTSLNRFLVTRVVDCGGVAIAGVQVQLITTRSAAASKHITYLIFEN